MSIAAILGGNGASGRGEGMKAVFSYLALSGILIGAVAATSRAQSGRPSSQGSQRKEKAQVVIVEKRDHGGKNGGGSGSTKPQKP